MAIDLWNEDDSFGGVGPEFEPDFLFTDRQMALKADLIELSRTTLRPNALESDENYLFPRKNFQALAELGILGLNVPESLGGMGENHVATSMVVETIAEIYREKMVLDGKADASGRPRLPLATFVLMHFRRKFGDTRTVKKKYKAFLLGVVQRLEGTAATHGVEEDETALQWITLFAQLCSIDTASGRLAALPPRGAVDDDAATLWAVVVPQRTAPGDAPAAQIGRLLRLARSFGG